MREINAQLREKFKQNRNFTYCFTRVVQKFKKLSETPATAPMIAKLCMNDCKNREIAEKLV